MEKNKKNPVSAYSKKTYNSVVQLKTNIKFYTVFQPSISQVRIEKVIGNRDLCYENPKGFGKYFNQTKKTPASLDSEKLDGLEKRLHKKASPIAEEQKVENGKQLVKYKCLEFRSLL